MLEVLHCLKQRGVRFYWLIVGGGRREEEARLKAKIDYLGMNDCVLMCGLLSPVAPVYRRASLMVMPSRNEAFGISYRLWGAGDGQPGRGHPVGYSSRI